MLLNNPLVLLCLGFILASANGKSIAPPEELNLGPPQGAVMDVNPEKMGEQPKNDMDNSSRLWPDGVLYYRIGDEFSVQETEAIYDVFTMYETKSCVTFVKRTTEDSYVSIQKTGGGCYSYTGRQPTQPQVVSLDATCFDCTRAGCNTGVLIHKFMHAFGVTHEKNEIRRDVHTSMNHTDIGRESTAQNGTHELAHPHIATTNARDEVSVDHELHLAKLNALYECPGVTFKAFSGVKLGLDDLAALAVLGSVAQGFDPQGKGKAKKLSGIGTEEEGKNPNRKQEEVSAGKETKGDKEQEEKKRDADTKTAKEMEKEERQKEVDKKKAEEEEKKRTRIEAENKEKVRKEAEAKEKANREQEEKRKKAEIKKQAETEKEARQKEVERGKKEEREKEAKRKQAEKKEKENREREKKRKEAERKKKEKQEREEKRKEAERKKKEEREKEAKRKQTEKKEKENREREKKRKEAERKETEREEKRKEAERKKEERRKQEEKRKEAERKEKEEKKAEEKQKEAERKEKENRERKEKREEAERKKKEEREMEEKRKEAEKERKEIEAKRNEAERNQKKDREKEIKPKLKDRILNKAKDWIGKAKNVFKG
ncbi:axoneme-associated protein mst101(2)-like [Daphnia carinata]|uniref:axoneme-associated protein mst101(2)-like n=1 Tax=Daphnia carinata TaxID=120202 RepID=UPI00257B9954|nr:axoneme-associated protein mst101(2)-like [Daphnia carinata]